MLTVGIAGAAAATMAGTPLLGIAVVAIVAIILVPVGRMGGGDTGGYLAFGVVLIGVFTVSFLWIVIFLIGGKNLRFGWSRGLVYGYGRIFFGRTVGGVAGAADKSEQNLGGIGGGILLASIWSGFC